MRRHQNGTLTEAMALLVHNQAAFIAQLGETQNWRAEMESRVARMVHSLEEIKAVLVHQGQVLNEHSQVLKEHTQLLNEHAKVLKELPNILAQLPEEVRRKIGFKNK